MGARPGVPLLASPGGIGGGNGPFWTAVELGLFAQHGANVSVKQVRGGSAALGRALQAGEIHFANLAAPPLIQANLDGADLVCVMGIVNKLLFQVMTVPEVRTPGDLRGKRVASEWGNTSVVLWQWYLPQHGLQPGTDVELVEIADTADQMDALRQRRIHAMTLSPAGSTYLQREGFNELIDFERYNVDFQLGCVVAPRTFVARHPDETIAYLRAYVDAMRRYRRDRALGLRILKGYTRIEDESVLAISYDMYARNFLDWPFPNVKGFETVIAALAQIDDRVKGMSPMDFIDLRFLEEIRRTDGA